MILWLSKFRRVLLSVKILVGAVVPVAAQNLGVAPDEDSLAKFCAVLYNQRDPNSIELADFYATRRGIPKEQVIGLHCPVEEEITREQFEFEISRPLQTELTARGLWQMNFSTPDEGRVVSSQIRFLAVIKGVPLKIKAGPAPEGDRPELVPESVRGQTAAAVDSELAALGFARRQVSGFVPNPYYRSFQPITDFRDAPVLLVARLDGPSEAVVRRMIYDSLDVEKTGLWGRGYFDMRDIQQDGYREGDEWINSARQKLMRAGMPAVWDWREKTFATEFPMDDAAIYFGWYSASLCGPVLRSEFQFTKGAVAAHIFSFSASTLRDSKGSWTAALLDRGAAATFGNVYEPFLQFTTQPDLFTDRLIYGMTFAESAYAATRTLSWMNTFIGDPLYRPFAAWNAPFEEPQAPKGSEEFVLIRKGHKMWFNSGQAAGQEYLSTEAQRTKSGAIYESLGSLQLDAGDVVGAARSFAKARSFYNRQADLVRTYYQQAEFFRRKGRKRDALDLLGQYFQNNSSLQESFALKDLLLEIDPPLPTPAPSVPPRR